MIYAHCQQDTKRSAKKKKMIYKRDQQEQNRWLSYDCCMIHQLTRWNKIINITGKIMRQTVIVFEGLLELWNVVESQPAGPQTKMTRQLVLC